MICKNGVPVRTVPNLHEAGASNQWNVWCLIISLWTSFFPQKKVLSRVCMSWTVSEAKMEVISRQVSCLDENYITSFPNYIVFWLDVKGTELRHWSSKIFQQIRIVVIDISIKESSVEFDRSKVAFILPFFDFERGSLKTYRDEYSRTTLVLLNVLSLTI